MKDAISFCSESDLLASVAGPIRKEEQKKAASEAGCKAAREWAAARA